MLCDFYFASLFVVVVRMRADECRGNDNQPLVSAATSGTSSAVDATVVRRFFTTTRHRTMSPDTCWNVALRTLLCPLKKPRLCFFCPSNSWPQHQQWRMKVLVRCRERPTWSTKLYFFFPHVRNPSTKELFSLLFFSFLYSVASRAVAAPRQKHSCGNLKSIRDFYHIRSRSPN